MTYPSPYFNTGIPRHKVFISYHHRDQYYRDLFELQFGHVFCSKSVGIGEIATDLSTDYVARLIRENYLDDASVCIVLVGAETYGRKHVDWEIAAALSKKVGGYSGLLGILLPTHKDYGQQNYDSNSVPGRLWDNGFSGYARMYGIYPPSDAELRNWIEDAFQARISRRDLIRNTRPQMQRNTAGCD